jgi:hypothetical protein
VSSIEFLVSVCRRARAGLEVIGGVGMARWGPWCYPVAPRCSWRAGEGETRRTEEEPERD